MALANVFPFSTIQINVPLVVTAKEELSDPTSATVIALSVTSSEGSSQEIVRGGGQPVARQVNVNVSPSRITVDSKIGLMIGGDSKRVHHKCSWGRESLFFYLRNISSRLVRLRRALEHSGRPPRRESKALTHWADKRTSSKWPPSTSAHTIRSHPKEPKRYEKTTTIGREFERGKRFYVQPIEVATICL